MEQVDAIAGAILGCAVGDAIGLPYEGLSKRRGVRLLGAPNRHRFLPSCRHSRVISGSSPGRNPGRAT